MNLLLIVGNFIAILFPIVYGQNVPGIPDNRELNSLSSIVKRPKISRGSGTGVIPFGYIVIGFLAFLIFVLLMGLALFYKREKGIRNKGKTLFLNPY